MTLLSFCFKSLKSAFEHHLGGAGGVFCVCFFTFAVLRQWIPLISNVCVCIQIITCFTFSLSQTVRFKNELERNITIKLGYANAKVCKLALVPHSSFRLC